MHLSEDSSQGSYIANYTAQAITIGSTIYHNNVLITPNGTVLPWSILQVSDLTEAACQELLSYQPEVIIIGTGAEHLLPDMQLLQYFAQHHVGIEIMNTAAACRTYNIVLAENRAVVAGLIL